MTTVYFGFQIPLSYLPYTRVCIIRYRSKILVSRVRLQVNMKVEEQFVLIVAKLDINLRAFGE